MGWSILAFNRDEFLDRPTLPAHWHNFDSSPNLTPTLHKPNTFTDSCPNEKKGNDEGARVLSGLDRGKAEGGTWLGINKDLKVALLWVLLILQKYVSCKTDENGRSGLISHVSAQPMVFIPCLHHLLEVDSCANSYPLHFLPLHNWKPSHISPPTSLPLGTMKGSTSCFSRSRLSVVSDIWQTVQHLLPSTLPARFAEVQAVRGSVWGSQIRRLMKNGLRCSRVRKIWRRVWENGKKRGKERTGWSSECSEFSRKLLSTKVGYLQRVKVDNWLSGTDPAGLLHVNMISPCQQQYRLSN